MLPSSNNTNLSPPPDASLAQATTKLSPIQQQMIRSRIRDALGRIITFTKNSLNQDISATHLRITTNAIKIALNEKDLTKFQQTVPPELEDLEESVRKAIRDLSGIIHADFETLNRLWIINNVKDKIKIANKKMLLPLIDDISHYARENLKRIITNSFHELQTYMSENFFHADSSVTTSCTK